MKNDFIAKASITINATPAKVWQALTDPAMIKQYLFGTEVTTDWKVGSRITYSGVWEGKAYQDKGTVLKSEPEKLLVSTFWSSLGGKPDTPENYNTVTYEIAVQDDQATLTISQDNNVSEEVRDHSQKNWDMVLHSLKDLLEK